MPTLAVPVSPEDHATGASSGVYTLVEYGDLQCPDTAAAEPEVQELLQRLGGKLKFVYRHFPLTDIHAHAFAAAEAVEAAAAQGRFWEMRQMLLDNQEHLGDADLSTYAERLGLDTKRFQRDMQGHAYAKIVDESMQGASRAGVEGTPIFFLNDEMIDPGLDLAEVFDSLEEEDDEPGDDE